MGCAMGSPDNQTMSDCALEKWSLGERHNRSQVIFTAVVESCLPAAGDGCQSAETADVRVKKVFKAEGGPAIDWEGRLVRVEGLRDPALCPSRVRLRDTRIFMTSRLNESHENSPALHGLESDPDNAVLIRVRLNSSLIAVSLRHLQQLRSFTKGIASHLRPSSFPVARYHTICPSEQ